MTNTNNNTNMPINNNYSGTIYDMGDAIPNYVNSVYTPHVWYDQSKRYQQFNNVFEKLMVSEGMLLGDSEDDMWTMEDIIEEVLQYTNLHIVQEGYDYYIFDWETARTDNRVVWLDIFTGETMTRDYNIVNVSTSMFASDDTQLTIDDVYNQVSVKDDVTEMDDVIFSPFDDDQLVDLTYPQLYMTEYSAAGIGKEAFHAFYDMVKQGQVPDTDYGKGSSAYKKNWYIRLKKPSRWQFLKNGQDIYELANIIDGNGNYENQWKLPQYLFTHPFTAAMLSFGEGDEFNKDNIQQHENVTEYTDYICINVGGNGADEKSQDVYDDREHTWAWHQPPTQFPRDTDIENSGLEIRYDYTTEGNYSPSTDDIHNYLVFTGKILMTTIQQATGAYGFRRGVFGFYGQEMFNIKTQEANSTNKGGNYLDWEVFARKDNNFSQYSSMNNNWETAGQSWGGRCVPTNKQDDGAYTGMLFYSTQYPEYTPDYNHGPTPLSSLINLAPPSDKGDLAKRFKYDFSKHSYLQASGNDYDVIAYVDVLACQLSIGDMYCEEYYTTRTENGISYMDKHYNWVSADDLMARGEGQGYDLLPDGTIRYRAYIYLCIDIDNSQFVVGEEHDFWSNITTSMGIDTKTGIAIPLPYDKHLSGQLSFSILGPVNNATWDNGIRRHKTWFRSETTTPNVISMLPHVGQIWIKNFKVTMESDRGKTVDFGDADIVYRSDEQKKYINKKDNITFKFTTALTAEEANTMGVNMTQNRSDVLNTAGVPILSITDIHTNETDKPEKIYVDAYYREYYTPRTILETTLHDSSSVGRFNKYNFGFMNGKTYYFMSEEKNVIRDTTKLRLKER